MNGVWYGLNELAKKPQVTVELTLEEQHAQMVAYLHLKVAQGDWHGVMDAAADLREIEAEIKGRTETNQTIA